MPRPSSTRNEHLKAILHFIIDFSLIGYLDISLSISILQTARQIGFFLSGRLHITHLQVGEIKTKDGIKRKLREVKILK